VIDAKIALRKIDFFGFMIDHRPFVVDDAPVARKPSFKFKGSPIIDVERIEELGGKADPAVCQIIGSFTEDLGSYLCLLDQQRKEGLVEEIGDTLHKLLGASKTCGFVGIGLVAEVLFEPEKRLNAKLHIELRSLIEASVEYWWLLMH